MPTPSYLVLRPQNSSPTHNHHRSVNIYELPQFCYDNNFLIDIVENQRNQKKINGKPRFFW